MLYSALIAVVFWNQSELFNTVGVKTVQFSPPSIRVWYTGHLLILTGTLLFSLLLIDISFQYSILEEPLFFMTEKFASSQPLESTAAFETQHNRHTLLLFFN